MLKPANIQVVTRIRAGSAVAGLASHACAYCPEPDRPEHEVRHAPVVVVDPQPDHADHRVGHQHRREPDRPEEAARRAPGVEHEGEPEGQRDVDERRHQPPGERVPGGLPEDVVARQDLPEVLEADELVHHAEVHPEGVDAVVEGDQDPG